MGRREIGLGSILLAEPGCGRAASEEPDRLVWARFERGVEIVMGGRGIAGLEMGVAPAP